MPATVCVSFGWSTSLLCVHLLAAHVALRRPVRLRQAGTATRGSTSTLSREQASHEQQETRKGLARPIDPVLWWPAAYTHMLLTTLVLFVRSCLCFSSPPRSTTHAHATPSLSVAPVSLPPQRTRALSSIGPAGPFFWMNLGPLLAVTVDENPRKTLHPAPRAARRRARKRVNFSSSLAACGEFLCVFVMAAAFLVRMNTPAVA